MIIHVTNHHLYESLPGAYHSCMLKCTPLFLETLTGFLHHMVFEKTDGPATYDIVTIAVWSGPEAIARARETMRD